MTRKLIFLAVVAVAVVADEGAVFPGKLSAGGVAFAGHDGGDLREDVLVHRPEREAGVPARILLQVELRDDGRARDVAATDGGERRARRGSTSPPGHRAVPGRSRPAPTGASSLRRPAPSRVRRATRPAWPASRTARAAAADPGWPSGVWSPVGRRGGAGCCRRGSAVRRAGSKGAARAAPTGT